MGFSRFSTSVTITFATFAADLATALVAFIVFGRPEHPNNGWEGDNSPSIHNI